MRFPSARLWLAFVSLSLGPRLALAAEDPAGLARGHSLYLAHCSMCHGATGDGIANVYPPLARSDWLAANRAGAIRAVVAGLSGAISVNGRTFNNQMPPIALDDAPVADVLTFVLNSWGNAGGKVVAEEVKTERAKTGFPTFAALKAAGDYAPLPPAPAGFALSELVRLNDFGVRLANDGRGRAALHPRSGGRRVGPG